MRNIKFSLEGKVTFCLSFVIGTLILLGYLLTKNDSLVWIGFYYVLIALIINLLMFFHELIFFLSNIPNNKTHGNSALLMLLNVPITILYISIVFNL
ncbi:hypothetical protein J3D55_001049 [Chryseobacterium ginsenosidimutans]|uniref:hypothetical protein n=1 Tax=Chryseobacterium ginsenosidimutans TaxID=687846 RepID=UPI00216A0F73|nr:hypothetical protein [Chryseobacterium ginsenosidimutans]MCS3868133.1 hypothetical protein [Chryseobacterium ginsenosidimutans]